jgi:ATP-dependent protease ClpP protease subunit
VGRSLYRPATASDPGRFALRTKANHPPFSSKQNKGQKYSHSFCNPTQATTVQKISIFGLITSATSDNLKSQLEGFDRAQPLFIELNSDGGSVSDGVSHLQHATRLAWRRHH